MNTRPITACVLALLVSAAPAIPPVGPAGEGRLGEPLDIRVFEPGRQYRLTHTSETTMPAMGVDMSMTFTQVFSVNVAAAPPSGAAEITMGIERVILTQSMRGGGEETLDSATAAVDHPMVEMIGVDFSAHVDATGEMSEFTITEQGRQGLLRAELGEHLDVLIPAYGLLLRDCLHYAPASTVGPGDTWDLSGETGPGWNLFWVLMMGGPGRFTLADQTECVLEALGGDGTPTVVTFTGSQEIVSADGVMDNELMGTSISANGRVVFDPDGDVRLSLLRRTVLTIPAAVGGAPQDMNGTIIDRIVLTPPDVDAPPREDLPDDGPTTQPADEEATTQPAPGDVEPPAANDVDEPTTQPTE